MPTLEKNSLTRVDVSQGLHSFEKSLNFRRSPWKVVEFHFSLKSPWIFFNFEFYSGLEGIFWCCPRQNINHSSVNLKVYYVKCSIFYAMISYQFKTSELKNVEKLVKQRNVRFCTGMCICEICEIIFLVYRWSLKSPWKMVAMFCMNPVTHSKCISCKLPLLQVHTVVCTTCILYH